MAAAAAEDSPITHRTARVDAKVSAAATSGERSGAAGLRVRAVGQMTTSGTVEAGTVLAAVADGMMTDVGEQQRASGPPTGGVMMMTTAVEEAEMIGVGEVDAAGVTTSAPNEAVTTAGRSTLT